MADWQELSAEMRHLVHEVAECGKAPRLLLSIRHRLDLTQEQMAGILGASRSSVTDWEHSVHPLNRQAIAHLLQIVRIEYFDGRLPTLGQLLDRFE